MSNNKNNLNTKRKDFLTQSYLPAYNNTSVNDFKNIKLADELTNKEIINELDKVVGKVNTTTRKLLDTALTYLTCNNLTKKIGEPINCIVKIPLLEYAEANGFSLVPKQKETKEEQQIENDHVKKRKAKFKRQTDLNLICFLNLNYQYKSNNLKTFMTGRIITDAGIENYNEQDYIVIKFNDSIVQHLLDSGIIQFPVSLLRHDGRNQNAYALGRYIAIHASIYNNIQKGTANTLSIKSLLKEAPEIITIEELYSQNQYKWKDRIKKPLEIALNENIKVGFLTNWIYRNPDTNEIFTQNEANSLSYVEFENLVVDYNLKENTFLTQKIENDSPKIENKSEKENYNFTEELPY